MNVEDFHEAFVAYEKKSGHRLNKRQRQLILGILLVDNENPIFSYRMFGDASDRCLPQSASNDAATDLMRLADRRCVEAVIAAILIVSQPTGQTILHCSATGRLKRLWMKEFLQVVDYIANDPKYAFQTQSRDEERGMIQIRNAKGVDCKVTAIALTDAENLRGMGESFSLAIITSKEAPVEAMTSIFSLIPDGTFVAIVFDE